MTGQHRAKPQTRQPQRRARAAFRRCATRIAVNWPRLCRTDRRTDRDAGRGENCRHRDAHGCDGPDSCQGAGPSGAEGLVARARYRSVFLTPDGAALAAACRQRHETVVRFLIRLGLDAATAETDAEGIEHHVSERTLALFKAFADQE